jgi:hypothetical protein
MVVDDVLLAQTGLFQIRLESTQDPSRIQCIHVTITPNAPRHTRLRLLTPVGCITPNSTHPSRMYMKYRLVLMHLKYRLVFNIDSC